MRRRDWSLVPDSFLSVIRCNRCNRPRTTAEQPCPGCGCPEFRPIGGAA